jgi:hypothetical protein
LFRNKHLGRRVREYMKMQRLLLVAAWVWTLLAGGGGLWLLVTSGPLPLTHGWFAFLSGVSACPLTASLLQRYLGITFSGRAQFAAAAFFFIAGRIALELEKYGVLHGIL